MSQGDGERKMLIKGLSIVLTLWFCGALSFRVGVIHSLSCTTLMS
jgi:hypothetical protein